MDCDRCGKHFEATRGKEVGEASGFILIWNRLFQGYLCEACNKSLDNNLTDSGAA